jgi:hypothetical protein
LWGTRYFTGDENAQTEVSDRLQVQPGHAGDCVLAITFNAENPQGDSREDEIDSTIEELCNQGSR